MMSPSDINKHLSAQGQSAKSSLEERFITHAGLTPQEPHSTIFNIQAEPPYMGTYRARLLITDTRFAHAFNNAVCYVANVPIWLDETPEGYNLILRNLKD